MTGITYEKETSIKSTCAGDENYGFWIAYKFHGVNKYQSKANRARRRWARALNKLRALNMLTKKIIMRSLRQRKTAKILDHTTGGDAERVSSSSSRSASRKRWNSRGRRAENRKKASSRKAVQLVGRNLIIYLIKNYLFLTKEAEGISIVNLMKR